MLPTRLTSTVIVSAVVLLSVSLSEVDAHNESVVIKQAAQSCRQCETPADWSKITGACFHRLGTHTNWFIRQPNGGDFKRCCCCEDGSKLTRPGYNGAWGGTHVNNNVRCVYRGGGPDAISAWYWNTRMTC